MTPFTCGCQTAPATLADYCGTHWTFDCHTMGQPHVGEGECPPCKLARLRSVNLDSSATPTRGKQ